MTLPDVAAENLVAALDRKRGIPANSKCAALTCTYD